jgi:hypothetical protein
LQQIIILHKKILERICPGYIVEVAPGYGQLLDYHQV